ncbi:MAG: hypothetical protein H7243_03120 [Sphingomonadaceae bacterium]|nr:hypothetical protein [Sphingomonadaceae bacterium]
MRWSDIDLEAATWVIGSADTKAGRAQVVPFSLAAVAKNKLDTFLEAQGGLPEPWWLHDLRRTVATHMVRLGVTETLVGRV